MRYYTTSEVADICKVHRNTILTAIRRGVLRIHRTPGGHARISQDDLDEFVHRRSLPATAHRISYKVLLIDDDPVFTQVTSSALANAGFSVRVALGGFEAGLMLAEFDPHAVILDLKLPDLRGDAVCRRIRGTPNFSDIVVLGVCTSSDKPLLDKMRRAGIDDFMQKPLDYEELLARLGQLLNAVGAARGKATSSRA
jgi:excisionase family DNA binding protein